MKKVPSRFANEYRAGLCKHLATRTRPPPEATRDLGLSAFHPLQAGPIRGEEVVRSNKQFSSSSPSLRVVGFVRQLVLAFLAVSCAGAENEELGQNLKASVLSNADAETFLFSIPAPRGLILDRRGKVLAGNRTVYRAAIQLARIPGEDSAEVIETALKGMDALSKQGYPIEEPKMKRLQEQWKNRRPLPYPVSAELTPEQATESGKPPGFTVESEYRRYYPGGDLAAHIIGYVSRNQPYQTGPFVSEESLWPIVQGRTGIEKTLNETLKGKDGLLSLLIDPKGAVVKKQIVRRPQPGQSVVLTLDAEIQQLAQKLLAEQKRPGALVAVDAETGDILAMASHPSFDLNRFVPSMDSEEFTALKNAKDAPFFARSFRGLYPPGSAFKPIVALAALERGSVYGISTQFPCCPILEIAGRDFHNWHEKHEGSYDVRYAMMRSCNTWFYQAALETGGAPILDTARMFGLGQKPGIQLDGVASGTIPDRAVSPHAIANLGIGQGAILASPLQIAMVMAGLANGRFVPDARLVHQIQTAAEDATVTEWKPVSNTRHLNAREQNVVFVRQGMFGVVNGGTGTGKSAQMDWPKVYGKTGTAQWSKDSILRDLAWFAGFVDARQPRLAFAVLLEGEPGETLYGGQNAAPVAGEFLRSLYEKPETYAVKVPPDHDRRSYAFTGATPSSRPDPIRHTNGADSTSPTVRAQPIDAENERSAVAQSVPIPLRQFQPSPQAETERDQQRATVRPNPRARPAADPREGRRSYEGDNRLRRNEAIRKVLGGRLPPRFQHDD